MRTPRCYVTAAALFAVIFGSAMAHAQVSPAPSRDTANSSAKVAPKSDEGTGANPSKVSKNERTRASSVTPAPSKDTANSSAKASKKKTASSVAPAPTKDTANSSAKIAPKSDEGTGANPSRAKTP